MLDVLFVTGWTVKIRLHNADSISKRGKPPGVIGASLFIYSGEAGAEPPTKLGAWKFECNTGRTRVDLLFPSTLAPGSKVWIAAFWFNGHKQSGPLSVPVGVHLQGGTVSLAA